MSHEETEIIQLLKSLGNVAAPVLDGACAANVRPARVWDMAHGDVEIYSLARISGCHVTYIARAVNFRSVSHVSGISPRHCKSQCELRIYTYI